MNLEEKGEEYFSDLEVKSVILNFLNKEYILEL